MAQRKNDRCGLRGLVRGQATRAGGAGDFCAATAINHCTDSEAVQADNSIPFKDDARDSSVPATLEMSKRGKKSRSDFAEFLRAIRQHPNFAHFVRAGFFERLGEFTAETIIEN